MVMMAIKHKAQTVALRALNELYEDFAKYPICAWFINTIYYAVYDQFNFVSFTQIRRLPHPDMEVLSWTQLGESARISVHIQCMTDEEWMRCSCSAIEHVQTVVMPKFLFSLTKLKAKLNSHIQEVGVARSKMLASLAGASVALANVTVAWLWKQFQKGNISFYATEDA